MDKHYNISDFARRIGRSASTVRRWERDGLLTSKRLPSGHRYFDEDDVRGILGKADEKRLTVVYCRVSSHGQKDDLQSQVTAMEQYCLGAGIAVDEWIQEVGGGMNFKRKQFLSLMDRIAAGDISRLIVAHKDRLVRFGFDLLDHIAKRSACVIEVVNQESLSPQEEMTEDLLSDADLTEAQMMLYALKDGMDPDCAEAKRQYREMRKAVKEHNEKFPPPAPYRSKASKLRQTKREMEKQK